MCSQLYHLYAIKELCYYFFSREGPVLYSFNSCELKLHKTQITSLDYPTVHSKVFFWYDFNNSIVKKDSKFKMKHELAQKLVPLCLGLENNKLMLMLILAMT